MKTLEETLKEVMKHAVSGECRKSPSFTWHCGEPAHAVQIFAKNGYTVVRDFDPAHGYYTTDNDFFALLDSSADIIFGAADDNFLSNRFDPTDSKTSDIEERPKGSHSLVSGSFEYKGVARPTFGEEGH